ATAHYLARIGLLSADSGLPPQRCLQLAERGLAANATSAGYLHTLALAHYRAGQDKEALRRLQESEAAAAHLKDGAYRNWPARALLHLRLGQADEARRWLARAEEWAGEVVRPGSPEADTPSLAPGAWLEFQTLLREARARLAASAKDPAR